MSKFEHLFYVLWSQGFKEATAAIFITELRRVGCRVKLVGLTKRAIAGAYGLVLAPDLSLDEALALATPVTWVVIPSSSTGFHHLRTDPRLAQFFQSVQPACIITGDLNPKDRALLPTDCRLVEMGATDEWLVEKVRSLLTETEDLPSWLTRTFANDIN